MTFFNLLTLLSGIGFLTAIRIGSEAGFLGIFVGALVGLGVGVTFSAVMGVGGNWLLWRLHLEEAKLSPLMLILSWIFMFTAFLWITLSGVLGVWLTTLVLGILRLK